MKNKFIKITFLVFVLLAILFSKNMSFATEQLTENEENSYYSSGYYISKYDVNMVVNEDNSYDITETINAVFTGSNKHGIIRKIPINNTVIRNDGTTAKTHARITGIQVNKDYSISTEDGYKSIKKKAKRTIQKAVGTRKMLRKAKKIYKNSVRKATSGHRKTIRKHVTIKSTIGNLLSRAGSWYLKKCRTSNRTSRNSWRTMR